MSQYSHMILSTGRQGWKRPNRQELDTLRVCLRGVPAVSPASGPVVRSGLFVSILLQLRSRNSFPSKWTRLC